MAANSTVSKNAYVWLLEVFFVDESNICIPVHTSSTHNFLVVDGYYSVWIPHGQNLSVQKKCNLYRSEK